jgi:hypothetical protein
MVRPNGYHNWAGKPLRSLAIMLGYIRVTTTKTGLTVKAILDEAIYPKGQKVSFKDVDALDQRLTMLATVSPFSIPTPKYPRIRSPSLRRASSPVQMEAIADCNKYQFQIKY